jgi:hypothetical protein
MGSVKNQSIKLGLFTAIERTLLFKIKFVNFAAAKGCDQRDDTQNFERHCDL